MILILYWFQLILALSQEKNLHKAWIISCLARVNLLCFYYHQEPRLIFLAGDILYYIISFFDWYFGTRKVWLKMFQILYLKVQSNEILVCYFLILSSLKFPRHRCKKNLYFSVTLDEHHIRTIYWCVWFFCSLQEGYNQDFLSIFY